MESEPVVTILALRIMFTLAIGRFCQIVLRGLKAHEIGDLAWLLAVVMCITTSIELVKEVVKAITAFFDPIFAFISWFTNDSDGAKRTWWEWLNTYPKGGL